MPRRFFQQQFAELAELLDVTDTSVQRQCLDWVREADAGRGDRTALAELCLRCFISSQIDGICQQLAAQFGNQHGFTRDDLLPYVLDDLPAPPTRRPSIPYRSLATKILDSYDPNKAGLSTWVHRLVRTT